MISFYLSNKAEGMENDRVINLHILAYNEEKTAASFCHQVAAQFIDMFCQFNLVKNHSGELIKCKTSAP
jgi:hypothetical protein